MRKLACSTLCVAALIILFRIVLFDRNQSPGNSNEFPVVTQLRSDDSVQPMAEASSHWEEIALAPARSFSRVRFIDRTCGWASDGERSLYTTTDAGQSWREVPLHLPSNSFLTSFSFVSPSEGWVSYIKGDQEEASILHTDNAGQTWQREYEGVSRYIHIIEFRNELEGWAAGSKLNDVKSLRRELLVLHTSDRGHTWLDLSRNLNRVNNGNEAESDFLSDFLTLGSKRAAALTSAGHLFTTNDDGLMWKEQGTAQDPPYPTSFTRLGQFPDKEMWVIGGAERAGGPWGVFEFSASDSQWIKRRLSIRPRDAASLSNRELLIGGSAPHTNKESPWSSEREGVILYSSDRGENWTVVYRNAKIKSINSLSVLDRDHIWASGDGGIFLRLNSLLFSEQ